MVFVRGAQSACEWFDKWILGRLVISWGVQNSFGFRLQRIAVCVARYCAPPYFCLYTKLSIYNMLALPG